MPFSHNHKDTASEQDPGETNPRRPMQVPPLWQQHSGAHFATETSLSGGAPSPSVRDHFQASSSRVSTPRKMGFASRSPSSDETANAGIASRWSRRASVAALPVASLPSSPSVDGSVLARRQSGPPSTSSSWVFTARTSPVDVPPPPRTRAVEGGGVAADAAADGEAARAAWKQPSAYGAATDWLVGVSEEDASSTDARGYGCGEGVSRSSSTVSLGTPTRLACSAVPALAVADPSASGAVPTLLRFGPHGRSDSGEGSFSTPSHASGSDARPPQPPDVPLPPPHSSAADAQTSFVRAGMEALRAFTEQLRSTHTGDWGTADDPTGVRQTCGDCFHAHTIGADPLAEAEAARDKAGITFSLERFSPFYKLAIKELILDCDRRVANAPAAARERQEAHFRRTVCAAAAASSVGGPSLYRSACGASAVSTHSFDTLRHSTSMELLSTPVNEAGEPRARPGGVARRAPAEARGCLQVPTLATDGPTPSGKGTSMPLAHFPTAEETARAAFFVSQTNPSAGASLSSSCGLMGGMGGSGAGVGGVAGGGAGGAGGERSRCATGLGMGGLALTEDLTLEALLKALDYYIPYKQAAPMVFIGALAYLSRVAARCVSDYTSITHANWYRLTVLAVLTASKMYNEQSTHRLNRFFAAASGIPLAEMKRLEVDFLYLLDFDLLLTDKDVEAWLTWMEALALRHGLFSSLNHFVLGGSEPTEEPAGRRTDSLGVARHLRGPSMVSTNGSGCGIGGGFGGGGGGVCGSLLDSSLASPVHSTAHRRYGSCDVGTPLSSLVMPTHGRHEAPAVDVMDADAPDLSPAVTAPRLFSVAHVKDDPPTPPTLRELSRLADTPTFKVGPGGPSGPSGAPSPPSPSLFFSRGSRGTSTTGGAASSLHRPSHSTSTIQHHAHTLAPSSTGASMALLLGSSSGAHAGVGGASTTTTATAAARSAEGGAAAVRRPVVPTSSTSAADKDGHGGSRWGVMGRVKDVLGATASLVRGQLQVLSSPGPRPSPTASFAKAPSSSSSPSLPPRPHRSPAGPRRQMATTTPDAVAHHADGGATFLPTGLEASDADGYYDEQGCYHLYDDEGFYDEDGYYYFYEDVGYYDDAGDFHYYEDEGYYDEEGEFHYYDEEDEGELAAEDDDDSMAEDDTAFFERCRPLMRLSPPSL